jgi:hypothetical protein
MSENENAGPTIPCFSEMFRFADDSDVTQHARELRAEAFAYGINLDLRIFPGAIPPSKKAKLALGIALPPKRAQEIIYELTSKHYLNMTEALNAARCARDEKPLGDPVILAKRQADFEKAYYGRLRHSEKARRIVDLLRAWHGRQITERWNKAGGEQLENRIQLVLLSPLLNAVRALDTEFFEILAQAMQMLETHVRSSKDSTVGTGDTHLDLWLLQYGMRIAGTATHTVRELNEEHVSKFRTMSDKDLRERCQYLVIPLKPDKRGTAAVRYSRGGRSNVPTTHTKRAN